MLKNNILRLLPFGALVLSAPFAAAQDMSTEVVVDRTVDTSLPAASPLKSVTPAMLPAPAPDFSLPGADYSEYADYKPLVDYSRPPVYTGLAEPDTLPGYVWAGYFPAYNAAAQAGYRIVNTAATQAGASVGFEGYTYKDKFSDHTVRSNLLRASLYGSHVFWNGYVLSADADFAHNPTKLPFAIRTMNYGNAGATLARYTSGVRMDAWLRYGFINSNFYDESSHSHISQQLTSFGVNVLSRLDSLLWGGADFGAKYLDGPDSEWLVTLTPRLAYRKDNVEFNIGVRMDLGISVPGNGFHVAPDVSARWNIAPVAGLYLRATGGSRLNPVTRLYAYSPFAVQESAFAPSHSPYNVKAGVRLGDFGGFSADIFAGYARINDMLLPAYTGSTYACVQSDVKGWILGAEFKYTHNRLLDASLRLYTGPENIADDSLPYFDRPKFALDACADLRISPVWSAGLRYTLRTGRRYLDMVSTRNQSLGDACELELHGSWKLRRNLSLFASIDNLLNSRPQIIPGLAGPGVRGLVGLDFRF